MRNYIGVHVYIAPHQPRLDWQMWFAALGSYQSNPWLVHLVYRLLVGQKEGMNCAYEKYYLTVE